MLREGEDAAGAGVRPDLERLHGVSGGLESIDTHHDSHVGEDEKRDGVARVFAIVNGDERVVSGVVDDTRHQSSNRKRWRCHPDLNRGMVVLQTTALPLGYGTDGKLIAHNVGPRNSHAHSRRTPRIATRVCRIAGDGFASSLFAIWFGPRPPTEALKRGLSATTDDARDREPVHRGGTA